MAKLQIQQSDPLGVPERQIESSVHEMMDNTRREYTKHLESIVSSLYQDLAQSPQPVPVSRPIQNKWVQLPEPLAPPIGELVLMECSAEDISEFCPDDDFDLLTSERAAAQN